MMIRSNRIAAALVLAAALTLSISCADAANYTFSQDGFSGGGSLTGSFSGVDLNNDGVLDASYYADPITKVSEISTFSLRFSGDSKVADFALGYADLAGLIFDLNQGAFIGDNGVAGIGEGIAARITGNVYYLTGIGPNATPGGAIMDLNTSSVILTSTNHMVSVSAVPEPETWAMLLVGLGLVAIVSRRRGNDIAIW